MKTLLLALLIFAPLMNSEACYNCAVRFPIVNEYRVYSWDGEVVPKQLRAIVQEIGNNCKVTSRKLFIYSGQHRLKTIKLN